MLALGALLRAHRLQCPLPETGGAERKELQAFFLTKVEAGSTKLGDRAMPSPEIARRMMSSEIERKSRYLGDILRTIREFEEMAADLERQVRIEEDRTGVRDRSHFSYSTFAEAAAQRRDNLRQSVQVLREKLAAAVIGYGADSRLGSGCQKGGTCPPPGTGEGKSGAYHLATGGIAKRLISKTENFERHRRARNSCSHPLLLRRQANCGLIIRSHAAPPSRASSTHPKAIPRAAGNEMAHAACPQHAESQAAA